MSGAEDLVRDVQQFQRLAGQPIGEPVEAAPRLEAAAGLVRRAQGMARMWGHMRASLILEEAAELLEAMVDGDEVQVTAEATDLLYVVAGLGADHDLPLGGAWDEVHAANLRKFPGGVATLDDRGKVVKPDGWRPADVAAVVERHRAEPCGDCGERVPGCPCVDDGRDG